MFKVALFLTAQVGYNPNPYRWTIGKKTWNIQRVEQHPTQRETNYSMSESPVSMSKKQKAKSSPSPPKSVHLASRHIFIFVIAAPWSISQLILIIIIIIIITTIIPIALQKMRGISQSSLEEITTHEAMGKRFCSFPGHTLEVPGDSIRDFHLHKLCLICFPNLSDS